MCDLTFIGQYSHIIIYGAGKNGRTAVRWIKKKYPKAKLTVAITDKFAASQICENIISKCIYDLKEHTENVLVLISAQPMFSETMYYITQEIGFKNVFIADKKCLKTMERSILPIKQRLFSYIKDFPVNVARFIFSLFPLTNTIIFRPHTLKPEGSFDALYRYMVTHDLHKKYKIVWIVSDPGKYTASKNVRYISENEINSLKYTFLFSTGRFLIWENAPLMKLRPSQKSIHVTHGIPTIKNVHGLINIPKETDRVLISSENVIELQAYQMCMDKEKYYICGLPRLDDMFSKSNELGKLGISSAKTLIWMPTFRKLSYSAREDSLENSKTGIPLINTTEDISELNTKLKKHDFHLIIKIHPLQDLSRIDITDCTNISIVNNDILEEKQVNLYCLLGETDALISDYSSVVFDYLMLDKPLAFVLDDMNSYRRGFALDDIFEFMPGEKIYTLSELLSFIDKIASNEDTYVIQRARLKDYCHKYQDAHNCERFFEMLGEMEKE